MNHYAATGHVVKFFVIIIIIPGVIIYYSESAIKNPILNIVISPVAVYFSVVVR